ncbi:hypothetical protein E2C01_020678 [Portunus trituberculatus]|uniref:Secreted protein n=1 Tax=Portunus trituberculatus TaxID=210409 RepID=A0A5B7E283_PORTR|nr:hypothetical protein [Portunus trituberculatus]
MCRAPVPGKHTLIILFLSLVQNAESREKSSAPSTLTSLPPAFSLSSSIPFNIAKSSSSPLADTARHSSWPCVSLLDKETAGTATPSGAEFIRQNSACRSEICPRNSSRTSEILR